jgi:hypothetical protein
MAGKPDVAHQQLVGWVIDWKRPHFWRIALRDRSLPRKPVFRRIPPFWEFGA